MNERLNGCDFWQVDDLQVSMYLSRHKLLVFRQEVMREYIRQNLFEPGEPVSIPQIVSHLSRGPHHGNRLR